MNDLISREEALEALKETCPTVWTESDYELGQMNQWSSDELAILTAPSAEPKTGKWILDPDGMDWNIPAWRCSECGFVATHIGVEPNGLGDNPLNWAGSKFCPQCGARITGCER